MAYFSKDLNAVDAQGNPLDPEIWSDEIFTDGFELMSISDQFGEVGSGAMVSVDEDLSAQPGSTINYTFVPYEKMDAVLGNTTSVKANAAELKEFGLPIDMHIVNFPFRKKGRMTDQRLVWKFRSTAKRQLTRRQMDYNEDIIFAVGAGVTYDELDGVAKSHTSASDTTDRVNGDTRCIRASGGNSSAAVTAANSDNTALLSAMDANDKMNVNLIEDVYLQARARDPYIVQPLQLQDADPVYALFMSLRAARDLRRDPMFEKYQLAKINAGLKNDAFGRRAFGQWDNVLLFASERIIEFGTSGSDEIARNLFVGGEAVLQLFGMLQADFTEDIEDHERDYSAAIDTIRGEKKVTFNGTDVNIIQVPTASNKNS